MDTREPPSPENGRSEQIQIIRANAELVVSMFANETGFAFGFNQESVQWLDGYIEHIRTTRWTEDEFNHLVSNLGSYLGEAIIRSFGGEWSLDQRGWAVRWDEFNLAYPFIKVAKHLRNGKADSIYSFYAVALTMRKG